MLYNDLEGWDGCGEGGPRGRNICVSWELKDSEESSDENQTLTLPEHISRVQKRGARKKEPWQNTVV